MRTEQNRMYRENVGSLNACKGCGFECAYCKPSFQRQSKRQRSHCKILNEEGIPKCYTFEPHFHLDRLLKPLKNLTDDLLRPMWRKTKATVGDQFVFFPSSGDPSFLSFDDFDVMMAFARFNKQTKFLVQTKSPAFLKLHLPLPENVIVGITLESDLAVYPSGVNGKQVDFKYLSYSEISKAPAPLARVKAFLDIDHPTKYVTIEPILIHTRDVMVNVLRELAPKVIYIGYANDRHDGASLQLPEPTITETSGLYKVLADRGFTVRQKTFREAWYQRLL